MRARFYVSLLFEKNAHIHSLLSLRPARRPLLTRTGQGDRPAAAPERDATNPPAACHASHSPLGEAGAGG
eukprot:1094088-Amphidinium_carterae.1